MTKDKCIFCDKKKQKIIDETGLFFSVRDSYPVTRKL